MSLRTWKREFHIPPSRWTKANALDCVLKKYLGTRKPAMRRHGVKKDRGTLVDGKEKLVFDNEACALCKFYRNWGKFTCTAKCPLNSKLRGTCFSSKSPFAKWVRTGDPEPLIRALRRAIKKQAAQRS